jgi:hypothetical protein
LSCDSGYSRTFLATCDAGAQGYSTTNPYVGLHKSLQTGCYAADFNVILQ